MSKFELSKSIEARRLNARTGIPTSDPLVTIPFGAIVQDPVEDRDVRKFTYLGERYQCADEMFRLATVALAKAQSAQPLEPAPAAAAPAPEEPRIVWERLNSTWLPLMRTEVPGGWLVALGDAGAALVFYADPDHRWQK